MKKENFFRRLKAQYFHTKLSCQKPMFRQIEWEGQNGPITKDGVLPLTTFFFFLTLFESKNLF